MTDGKSHVHGEILTVPKCESKIISRVSVTVFTNSQRYFKNFPQTTIVILQLFPLNGVKRRSCNSHKIMQDEILRNLVLQHFSEFVHV